jgi:hypothetical protein
MSKYLVGYDGSESAKVALDRAAAMMSDGDTLGVISVAPIVAGGPRAAPVRQILSAVNTHFQQAEKKVGLARKSGLSVTRDTSGQPDDEHPSVEGKPWSKLWRSVAASAQRATVSTDSRHAPVLPAAAGILKPAPDRLLVSSRKPPRARMVVVPIDLVSEVQGLR